MHNWEGSDEDCQLDVVIAAGSSQVCAGLEGGCEAGVHAMRDFFQP